MILLRVFALAKVTCKEGIRDRSLFGIFLLALFLMGLNIAVAGFFMRDLGKVTVDINLSAISFAGLLLVFFVGINLMAKDIDKKTIHLVLSKPFSRAEYIWGKYLGLVLLVMTTLVVLLVLSCATVTAVHGMYPGFFGGFSWEVYFWAVAFIGFQLTLLCGIVVFFSTITTSSFITLIFSVATYLVGISLEEVLFYLKGQAASKDVVASEALHSFLEVVAWIVPNFAAFDFKVEAAHGLAIESGRLAISAGYGFCYIVLLLWLSTVIFRRREFN
ncbi:ABC transporter permease subunit [Desulfuromonas acetoxidans]|uniref:ABC transporter permease n=1 Tax=Desulfuromonas acetoxidans TaxID=891 RepID=UPI0029301586|nr:ABC transporter permease subunit [Desulfuromonas acetoxidans]